MYGIERNFRFRILIEGRYFKITLVESIQEEGPQIDDLFDSCNVYIHSVKSFNWFDLRRNDL